MNISTLRATLTEIEAQFGDIPVTIYAVKPMYEGNMYDELVVVNNVTVDMEDNNPTCLLS